MAITHQKVFTLRLEKILSKIRINHFVFLILFAFSLDGSGKVVLFGRKFYVKITRLFGWLFDKTS